MHDDSLRGFDDRRSGGDRRGSPRDRTTSADILGKPPRMLLGADRWIRSEIARAVSEEVYRTLDWHALPQWLRPYLHPLAVYHWLHLFVLAIFPQALTFLSVYLLAMKVITPLAFGLIGIGYVASAAAVVIIANIHTSRAQRAAIEKIIREHPGYANFLRAYASMRDPFDDADGKDE